MLKSRQELREMREIYTRSLEAEKRKILVCAGTGCVSGGSLEIFARLRELLEQRGIACSVELQEEPHEDIGMKKSGCHGFCEMGPLIRIEPEGWLYTKVKLDDCEEIVESTIVNGEHIERLAYQRHGVVSRRQEDIPFYKKQTRRVLEHCGHIDATSIKEYLGIGGYAAFEKALFDMTPEKIIADVSDAGLRGRGGGGFPAGRKWEQVRSQKALPKYIVCNGDEGDPGAFMDRSIMEGDPHRMLEGMMVAAVACGASEGYIYVRAEYPMAVSRLELAIEQATELGLLGDNILGTDFSFHMHINCGAGAFVCGEGSALTASIEGKRGMPRTKPPRTVEQGLFAKPTVLNNVETFANVPLIINRGVEWFRSVGTDGSPGTKAFAITGNIDNTGLIEVPMGTTLGEIVNEIGGGTKDGTAVKAVQIGGPSGGCLTKDHLNMPLDFDSVKKVGAIIGSGGLVVMGEDTCMVEIARFFMNFTKKESCGKCTTCRDGVPKIQAILEGITAGRGKVEDLDMIQELAETIKSCSLCGLGKTATNPVVSTMRFFKDEYLAHVVDKKCPAGVCKELCTYRINPEKCIGCTLCARNCPVDAISGIIKRPHEIDTTKCIKCGACKAHCRQNAIEEV